MTFEEYVLARRIGGAAVAAGVLAVLLVPAQLLTAKQSSTGYVRLTWQPVAGVRAVLIMSGTIPVDSVIAYAGTLTLERGHECKPRLKATALPAGGRLVGCSVDSSGAGTLTIRGDGGTVGVTIPDEAVFSVGVSPGATVKHLPSGRVYEQFTHDYSTASIRTPDPYAELHALGTYGVPEVLIVADGLQPS